MAKKTGSAQARREPKLPPIHPGELLLEEILPALGLSVTEAARQLRVSRQTLHRVLSGTSAVTPDMAWRLGKFCGNGPDLWMGLQQDYDLWKTRDRMRTITRSIPSHLPARRKRSA